MNEIEEAIKLLLKGETVAIPTETVYGLAANVADNRAVAKIYELKNRPDFNPLIVHVASLEQAQEIAIFNDKALELAKEHWPGGLTLVLPKKDKKFATLATAGLESVAVRCPSHPIALKIIKDSGLMLAAPSANISGKMSPTKAEHVRADFLTTHIVDGGECEVGLESTVVGFEGEQAILLRPGVLQIADAITYKEQKILSPGQLTKHYSPENHIRINANKPKSGEVYLGFGEMDCDLNLSVTANLQESAANLFSMLHELDLCNQPIAVTTIPNTGIGIAVNDRLKRAAN